MMQKWLSDLLQKTPFFEAAFFAFINAKNADHKLAHELKNNQNGHLYWLHWRQSGFYILRLV